MKFLIIVISAILLLSCNSTNETSNDIVNDSIPDKKEVFEKKGTVKFEAGNGSVYNIGYFIHDSVYSSLSKEDLIYITTNLQTEAYLAAKYPQTMRPDTSIDVNVLITPYDNNNIRASFAWIANNAFNVPDRVYTSIVLKNDKNPNTRDSIIEKNSF